MSNEIILAGVVFLFVVAAALVVGLLLTSGRGKVDARLDSLAGKARPEKVTQIARATLPKMGKAIVPEDEAERTKLRARLIHAGLYQPQAMYIFLGIKLIMLIIATIVGIGLTLTKALPTGQALMIAMGLYMAGMIGPSFWLDKRKAARQTQLRRGLPDALDVLVICLEGGLSLQSSLQRVTDELRGVHKQLGDELRIVDREIQLGVNIGEALRHMAQRTDLEEALSLASVVAQSERFGASMTKSLRNHSENLRSKRKQKAEERAQKAATKMLVPTLLFIFPAVFIILLAPAAFEVQALFVNGNK